MGIREVKTTRKHFALFIKECKKWIKRFELNEWRFDFVLEELDDKAQAETQRNYRACVNTICFHTTLFLDTSATVNEFIKDNAKHEIVHVLVSNLAMLGHSRYITLDEIDKAEEGLVRKLQDIIK